jgi:hypothetical protein
MSYYQHGKYLSIDPENPEALGICDYTGFVFPKKDLVRQMEWRGEGLVWTGFYVGRPFVDKPNEQNRTPIFPPDPVPVLDPRPPFMSVIAWNMDQSIFSQNLSTFDTDQGVMLNAPALPVPQRVQELQNYNWGAG